MDFTYSIEQIKRGTVTFNADSEQEAQKHIRAIVSDATDITKIPGIHLDGPAEYEVGDITGLEVEDIDLGICGLDDSA